MRNKHVCLKAYKFVNAYLADVHNFQNNVANLCKMCMRRGKERERVK